MPALAAALVVLALPPLAGFLAGVVARRTSRAEASRARRRALVALGVVAACVAIACAARTPFGAWDVLLAAATAAAGWLLAARAQLRAHAGPLAASGLATVLGLACVELAARTQPPPNLEVPVATDQGILRSARALEDPRCRWIAGGDAAFGALAPAGDPRRTIVHLGDSMLEARDVPSGERFADLIAAARPAERHLNLGVFGTGPDVYLVTMRAALAHLRADEVVVHLYLGNDLRDLGQPYGCCEGPLLGPAERGLPTRCASGGAQRTLAEALDADPLPYPLRVASRWSWTARHAQALLERWRQQTPGRSGAEWEPSSWCAPPERVAALGPILSAMQRESAERGAALTLVLLPPRWPLEQRGVPACFQRMRAETLALAEARGIRTRDAWDAFQRAVDRRPDQDWFMRPGTGNPHFGVAGHRLFADWYLAEVAR